MCCGRALALSNPVHYCLVSDGLGKWITLQMCCRTCLPPVPGAVEGWVPSADASCDPGWMLPLTLFSLAYSSFIMTGG